MASNAVAAFNAAASESPVVDIGARPASALAAITPRNLKDLLEMGRMLVASGLMPEGVTKPEAAAAIVLKGIELDVPPMAAIEGISIIKGKPACGAHLMIGLIKRKHGGGAIRVSETTPEGAVVQYREPGWGDVRTFTFTIDDARRAGLVGDKNMNWQRYPAAMLRARAISAVAKMAFADVAFGLMLPDELGAEVEVMDDGDVRIVDAQLAPDASWAEQREKREAVAAARRDMPQAEPPPPSGNVVTKDDLDALQGETSQPPLLPEKSDPQRQSGRITREQEQRIASLQEDLKQVADWTPKHTSELAGRVCGITSSRLLRREQADEVIAAMEREFSRLLDAAEMGIPEAEVVGANA